MKRTLITQRNEFVAEFDALESSLTHACRELAKLMASRMLNAGALFDAENHARASITALRNVAEQLPDHAHRVNPRKPERAPADLAGQLETHRIALVHTLDLVKLLPDIDQAEITRGSNAIARALVHLEGHTRDHQPPQ